MSLFRWAANVCHRYRFVGSLLERSSLLALQLQLNLQQCDLPLFILFLPLTSCITTCPPLGGCCFWVPKDSGHSWRNWPSQLGCADETPLSDGQAAKRSYGQRSWGCWGDARVKLPWEFPFRGSCRSIAGWKLHILQLEPVLAIGTFGNDASSRAGLRSLRWIFVES